MCTENGLCKSLTKFVYPFDKRFSLAIYTNTCQVLCHNTKRNHLKYTANDDNGYTVNKQVKTGLSDEGTWEEIIN